VFALLSAYSNPVLTQNVVSALGNVLSPIVVVVVGAAIYLAYRIILGEWILYPTRHGIHFLLDKRRRRNAPDAFISFTALLAAEGVPFGMRRYAYSEIRDCEGILDHSTRERLDLIHATYHFLYLTSVESIVAAWYIAHYANSIHNWKALSVISGICIVAAFVADIRQDSWECRLLRQDRNQLRQFLKERHYVS
jgi:hypothetical protein